MKLKFEEKLGSKSGYDYLLFSNLYVYQFKGTHCLGWFCSYIAWERELHKILN